MKLYLKNSAGWQRFGVSICAVLVGGLFLFSVFGPKQAVNTAEGGVYFLADIAKVISSDLEYTDDVPGGRGGKLLQLDLVVVSKPYAGKKLYIETNAYPANELQGIVYRQGDRVIIYATRTQGLSFTDAYIVDLYRQNSLLLLCVIFALFLLFVGGKHGMGALFGLLITGSLVWFWLLPFILRGGNPLLGTAGICGLVAIISVPLISGVNRKTAAAIIGVVVGVTLAAGLAILTGEAARIVGIEYESTSMLAVLPQAAKLDLRGIYMAGILIGCLGAMMDTGLSVASAVYEMRALDPGMSRKSLWQAGMNVGRDILAMMSSTLILAYAGTAVPLMMILAAHQVPFLIILNSDMIAAEIIRSIAGTIGLCLAVPATIGAVLLLCKDSTPCPGQNDSLGGPAKTAEELSNQPNNQPASAKWPLPKVLPHHTQEWWDKLEK